MSTIWIIDIDQTLTIEDATIKPITDEDWHNMYYYAKPNFMVINCIDALFACNDISYICTGRKLKNKDVTRQWLDKKLSYNHLIMRDDHDNRSAIDVKRDMYLSIMKLHGNVSYFLIDDDMEVLEMAASIGIRSLHPNEFVSKYKEFIHA